jgi:hypothetical protein
MRAAVGGNNIAAAPTRQIGGNNNNSLAAVETQTLRFVRLGSRLPRRFLRFCNADGWWMDGCSESAIHGGLGVPRDQPQCCNNPPHGAVRTGGTARQYEELRQQQQHQQQTEALQAHLRGGSAGTVSSLDQYVLQNAVQAPPPVNVVDQPQCRNNQPHGAARTGGTARHCGRRGRKTTPWPIPLPLTALPHHNQPSPITSQPKRAAEDSVDGWQRTRLIGVFFG